MPRRQVTASAKLDGDIIGLCNLSGWGRVSKTQAILEMESGIHSYFVQVVTPAVNVQVINGPHGKFLRTVADGASMNNLDNSPDC